MNAQKSSPSINYKVFLVVILFAYLYPLFLFFVLPPTDNATVKYIRTIVSALIIGVVAIWAIRKENIRLETIGFQKTKLWQVALISLIGWIVFAMIYVGVLSAAGEDIFPFLGKPRLIFQQWLFVGMGEELLFRGYLITSLLTAFARVSEKWHMALAVFIGNSIFATAHIPVALYKATEQGKVAELLSYIPAAFLVGLILSYFFLRTHNVLLAGLIHGSINAPLIGKEDDPLTLLAVVVVFVIATEAWMFVQSKLNSNVSSDPHPNKFSN